MSVPETPPRADAIESAVQTAQRILDNIETVVRGKRREVSLVLCALACEGHILIEDVPGTAKTVLARALAQSIDGASVSRVQCTPDLQPTDVTGLAIFDQRTREFEFRPGPIFANIVLVDEVNRAMPKTQSALLEAMAEGQVTVDGVTRQLEHPFLLLATDNPIEHEGTFPLPEAQLDRFFMRIALGYPGEEDEVAIVRDQRHGHPLSRCGPVVSVEDVRGLATAVEEVYIDDLLQRWIVRLVRSTRELDILDLSASVRASLALERAARAWALLEQRDHVVPEDVERLFPLVVGHRVLFSASFAAETRSLAPDEVLDRFWQSCLALAPRPR